MAAAKPNRFSVPKNFDDSIDLSEVFDLKTGDELSNVFDPSTLKECKPIYDKLQNILSYQQRFNETASPQINYISNVSLDKFCRLSADDIRKVDDLIETFSGVSVSVMFSDPKHTRNIMKINSIIQTVGGKKRKTRRKHKRRIRTRR